MDRDFETREEEDGARMNVASIQSHSPIFAVARHICSFPFLFQDLCNRFAALAITESGSAKARVRLIELRFSSLHVLSVLPFADQVQPTKRHRPSLAPHLKRARR